MVIPTSKKPIRDRCDKPGLGLRNNRQLSDLFYDLAVNG